jgi:hypothetical protein
MSRKDFPFGFKVRAALAFVAAMTYLQLAALHSFANAAESSTAATTASSSQISGAAATEIPSKKIDLDALQKWQPITVAVDEHDAKVTYTGVPLRAVLKEMLNDTDIDSMPEWKKLARKALVMEVVGNDGFPGLIATTEIAMNKSGDRFILATQKDGTVIETGVHLICKADEAHTRWVRSVVSVRLISVANKQ